jgi:hypothetical protein
MWLSRRGRLKLVKLVLEAIHIYSYTFPSILVRLLEKIIRKCFKFLWTCKKKKKGIPLVKWKELENPKGEGG